MILMTEMKLIMAAIDGAEMRTANTMNMTAIMNRNAIAIMKRNAIAIKGTALKKRNPCTLTP